MPQPPKPFNVVDKVNLVNHLKIMIDNLNSMIGYFGTIPAQTPCQNCTFFDQGNCKKWNSKIPEEVLPHGCENFFYNESSAPF